MYPDAWLVASTCRARSASATTSWKNWFMLGATAIESLTGNLLKRGRRGVGPSKALPARWNISTDHGRDTPLHRRANFPRFHRVIATCPSGCQRAKSRVLARLDSVAGMTKVRAAL